MDEEPTNEEPKHRGEPRDEDPPMFDDNPNDWQDARAWMAILTVAGAFILQFAILFDANTGEQITTVPSWITAVLMAIVGFYFGQKNS